MAKDQVADSFGRYFADAERAKPQDVASIVAAHGAPQPPAFLLQGSELPSLAALAAGFASLQTGRAAGLSGIPPEAYRACPLQQALLYYPALCKMLVRDPAPFQWRGGLAVCIPKPNKPRTQHQGYRSIMLLEGDTKAMQKSMRPALLQALPVIGVADQMGGRPGFTLALPAAHVKAHLSHLRRVKGNGAVIFVDAASAYYSIAKDLLSITPTQRADRSYLRARAQALFTHEEHRHYFVERMFKSETELSQAMSAELRLFLQKQLQDTWYVTRHNAPAAFVAGSGTTPGSPLADVMFSLIFGELLRKTRDFLCTQGWQSVIASNGPAGTGYTPTWADDVCILLTAASARAVPEAVTCTAGFFIESMHRAGLKANLGAGKTEAMLCFHGPDSRAMRQQLFCQAEPSLPFSTPHETGRIRLTATYDYLGTTVQADGHPLPDIRRRRDLARETFRPLKARIMRNPALTRSEKIDLIRSRVLPRMLYGAGLWSVSTQKEEDAIQSAIFGFYRGSFQPLFGVKSQGYTNLEVAGAIGLPTPEELLAVERVRAATQLARGGFRTVLEELSLDPHWWPAVLQAAKTIELIPPDMDDFSDILQRLAVPRSTVRAACKKFVKRRVTARRIDWADIKPRPPCDTALIVAAQGAALPWQCSLCQSAFGNKRGLAVHMAGHHGHRALQARTAVGTRCEVCAREFWSRFRLAEHLRRSPHCQHVYAEAEIEDQPEVARSQDGAWRPCVVSHGPRPWWATLNP